MFDLSFKEKKKVREVGDDLFRPVLISTGILLKVQDFKERERENKLQQLDNCFDRGRSVRWMDGWTA